MTEASAAAARDMPLKATLSLIALGVMGALGTFTFLPVVVGVAVDFLGFSPQQAGSLVSAEMGGAMIGTLGAFGAVRHVSRPRLALTGCGAILLGSMTSTAVTGWFAFLAVRAVVGLGEGLVIATVISSIAGVRDPERLYGIWTIGNMVIAGVILAGVMPQVAPLFEGRFVFVLYAVFALLGAVLVIWYPEEAAAGGEAAPLKMLWTAPVVLALVAVLAAHVAHGGIWAYLERVGVAGGAPREVAIAVLGAASFAGIAAGILVSVLSTRYGRVRPNLAALGVSITSLAVMTFVSAGYAFAVSAILFYIAWTFGLPYLMGVIAELDKSGRASMVAILMQNAGLMAGPLLFGLVWAGQGKEAFALMGMALYALALITITSVALGMKTPSRPAAP